MSKHPKPTPAQVAVLNMVHRGSLLRYLVGFVALGAFTANRAVGSLLAESWGWATANAVAAALCIAMTAIAYRQERQIHLVANFGGPILLHVQNHGETHVRVRRIVTDDGPYWSATMTHHPRPTEEA